MTTLSAVPFPGTLYLLRHGETVWNRERRLQGRADSPLTERGIAQVRAMADRLAAELASAPPSRLVCSPLGRARQSAAIVAERLGRPATHLEVEPRLAEIAFGHWDGLTWEEIQRDHSEEQRRRAADRWNVAVGGGESFAQATERVRPWLLSLEADRTVVAVCHGALGRVIRGLYGRLPPTETLALDEPQDAFFRLAEGRIERLSSIGEPT